MLINSLCLNSVANLQEIPEQWCQFEDRYIKHTTNLCSTVKMAAQC